MVRRLISVQPNHRFECKDDVQCMVETSMVIVPYTAKPPVLNIDKMADYIVQVFLKFITTLQSVHLILGKLKPFFGKLFKKVLFFFLIVYYTTI